MKELFKARINTKLLKYNLSTNKAYFIVFSVLLFASSPLFIIINYITNLNQQMQGSADFPHGIIIVGLMLALITPFITFNYLNSKKSVDVFHALPIKRKDLLITQITTSFLLVYLPVLLNYIITLILFNAFKYAVPAKMYLDLIPLTILLFSIHLIPIFVMNNTGTTSDGLIHTAIATALPFAAYGAILFFSTNYIFGLSMFKWDSLKFFSPIYALFTSQDKASLDLFNLLYWIVMNFIGLSFINKLYNERKSEKSEEPFTNNVYFPIVINIFIPIIFIFTNVLALPYNSVPNLRSFFTVEAFVLPFLICFVVYIVLNIFRYRSTKFFKKSTIDFLKVMLVTTLISTTIIYTDGLGYAWKIPNEKDIIAVKFKPMDLQQVNNIFLNNFDPYSTYELEVRLKDEKSIKLFTQIHKGINQNFKKNQKKPDALINNAHFSGSLPFKVDSVHNFSFTYELTNGKEVKKTINLPYSVMMDFAQLLTLRDYQITTNPLLNSDIKSENINIFNSIKSESLKVNSDVFIDEFRSAYLEDIQAMRIEDYLFKPSKLKYIVQYTNDVRSFKQETQGVNFNIFMPSGELENYIFIDDRFVNTMNFLNTFELNRVSNLPEYARYSTSDMEMTSYSAGVSESSTMGIVSFDRYIDSPMSFYSDYPSQTVSESIKDKLLGTHLREKKSDVFQVENIFIPIE